MSRRADVPPAASVNARDMPIVRRGLAEGEPVTTMITERLQRLRTWFVAYYAFNLIVATWASVIVVDALRFSAVPDVRVLEHVSGGLVTAYSLLVGVVIFGVALALFHQLLQRRDWARVTMLVIAWLTALSAGMSLLSSGVLFSPSGWLSRMMPEANWGIIGLTSVATNVASLAFSVYMIRTLQFDQRVRAEFITARTI